MIVRDDGIKFYEGADPCNETDVLHIFQDNMMIMLDKIEKIEQQQQIVRCKDCKHWESENGEFGMCKICHSVSSSNGWFCADGERKDNGKV